MNYKSLCINCFAEKGAKTLCPVCGYAETNLDQPEATLYLPPRTILAGKYLTGKVLGQGGFGITYLGWDLNLGVKLAIKEFFPQGLVSRLPGQSRVVSLAGTEAQKFDYWLERFLKEARTLAQFEHHPNIVKVRDFFKEHNTAYMVMSYVEGLTLEQYLVREGGRLPFDRASEILMPVLDALREIHEVGFMHRDISPDNIFIDKRGRVVLIDFGAARQEIREKSKSLSVILKAGYAPEEQYRSRGKQGPWTDIYAAGATLYRCLAGQVPPEAMDRLAEDDLVPPSQLGVKINNMHERALLKALAVRAEDRYQSVEEFQVELLEVNNVYDLTETRVGVRPRNPLDLLDVDVKQEEPAEEMTEGQIITEKQPAKNAPQPEAFSPAAGKSPTISRDKEAQNYGTAYTFKKKVLKYSAAFVLGALLLVGGITLFGGGGDTGRIDPDIIARLDADYYIDYENGTIPLSDLPIGARVADPTWEWEFRLGIDYSDKDIDGNPTGTGEVKPVTWIVVAKDHYEGMDEHVTMLSADLIGRFAFDNSTHHTAWGYNHWGECGTDETADRGLRPWLNSTGIHSEEGFYYAFSDNFKRAVITTIVPNRMWNNGNIYSTEDRVFVPSTTELGDNEHNRTYPIGSAYPYFLGAGNADRVAYLAKEISHYWLRSPSSQYSYNVRRAGIEGEFNYYLYSDCFKTAVRPVLNLAPDLLVSKTVKAEP